MNIKRSMDVVIAGVVIILTFPFWLIIALLIQMDSKGSVFFRQLRPGLHGRPFTMVKFRTMKDAKDTVGNPLPDAQRLTAFGTFLRTASLDELPELINVLRGEMSLVGPRPLLMQYLPRYTPEQFRRHEAKPGITGWAQINGRNAMSWESKFAHDVWYVDHWSLWLDVRILAVTFWRVIRRHGISEPGYATMSEFKGTSPPAK